MLPPTESVPSNGDIPSGIIKLGVWAIKQVGLPTVFAIGMSYVMISYFLNPQALERTDMRAIQQKLIDSTLIQTNAQRDALNAQATAALQTAAALQSLTSVVADISKRQALIEGILQSHQSAEKFQAEQTELVRVAVVSNTDSIKELAIVLKEMKILLGKKE